MAEQIWELRGAGPWGGYGQLLLHGMSHHRGRVEGRIQLERAAPYIPPLSLPGIGDIVVTSAFRERLEREGITGATFQRLDKAHIVHINWHHVLRHFALLRLLVRTTEPEGFILGLPHDPAAAASLGELWELVPHKTGIVERQRDFSRLQTEPFALKPGTRELVDISQPEDTGAIIVSQRFRSLLESVDSEALSFRSVLLGSLRPPGRFVLNDGEVVPEGYVIIEQRSIFGGRPLRVAHRVEKPRA